jgi:polygalacturonase
MKIRLLVTCPPPFREIYTHRPAFLQTLYTISVNRKIFATMSLAASLGGASLGYGQGRVCDPRTFGAKADGASKDTHAIQAAIDSCAQKGGGIVKLGAGTFVSGPIVLKSNITLEVDKGATLLGSSDHADYPPKTEFRQPAVEPLVIATNASNVSITGGGVIDGAGESWWKMARGVKDAGVMGIHPRPRLVVFDHCKHVRVEDVTLQNSAFWQLVPYYSDDIVIRNIRVLAPANSPNTDAVDPFSSSNITIDHLYADVGDDDIAIKSGAINSPGGDQPSKNIHITDSTFLHGHGLSIGSEIAGGAQNVVAERIHFNGTANGIRVKANRDRGNNVGPLVFRDLDMKDVKTAILISEYYPKVVPEGDVAAAPVTRLTPHFHDISIENLTAAGGEVAGIIIGLPESPVERVVLKNVSIQAAKGLTVGYAEVSGEKVSIRPQSGDPIVSLAGAKVSIK